MDRRAILKKLISERFAGKQADFARAIKRSPAQVNQWLTGFRNLGNAGARQIELALGLGLGYFDGRAESSKPAPAPAQTSTDEAALLAYYRALPEKERARLMLEIEYKARLAALDDQPATKQQAA